MAHPPGKNWHALAWSADDSWSLLVLWRELRIATFGCSKLRLVERSVARARRWSQLTEQWRKLAIAASLVWFAAPLATAQAAEAQPSVLLVVPETEPNASMLTLQRVLVGRLNELGVELRFSAGPFALPRGEDPARPPQDVLAFIWLETRTDSIVVHFYEAAGAHLRERRVPVEGINAASIEEVAIVVRSAVSALLERSKRSSRESVNPPQDTDSEPGRPVPEADGGSAEAPDGVIREPASNSSAAPIRLSVGYVAQDYAPSLRWNHGVTLALAWQGWAGGGSLGVAYSWMAPIIHRTEQLEVALLRHPVELVLGWELPLLGSWLKLRPEGALGVDGVFRETRRSSEAIEATANQRRWSWGVSGRLALVLSPLGRWQGFVAAGADSLLNRFSYTVAGDAELPLIEPRRWRPVFHCGVAIELP